MRVLQVCQLAEKNEYDFSVMEAIKFDHERLQTKTNFSGFTTTERVRLGTVQPDRQLCPGSDNIAAITFTESSKCSKCYKCNECLLFLCGF